MPVEDPLPDLAELPSWHPPLWLLELAELVVSGALAAAPVPVDLPAQLADGAGAAGVVLEDAEATPVALLLPRPGGIPEFRPLRAFGHGPVRAGRRAPARVRAELAQLGPAAAGAGVLAVVVTSLLAADAVQAARARARSSGRPLLWLAVLGAQRPSALPPAGLWRALREVAREAAAAGDAGVAAAVAIPLPGSPDAAQLATDRAVVDAVARAYGGTEVLVPPAAPAAATALHPAFARERERAVPPPHRRGVTVFFTGLSGSGKSTVAKALADELADRSDRTHSLLDGDEVRRLLSAGLGFARADRDLNIRRIGFVATEVTRNGGLAICAPIAPFAQARAQVRAAVEEVGDFVLVHISTPLEECERRDRKGLYARARAGLIPEFTGISSPYEEPVDADLRLDTSQLPVTAAVGAVWQLLVARGYLTAPPSCSSDEASGD